MFSDTHYIHLPAEIVGNMMQSIINESDVLNWMHMEDDYMSAFKLTRTR